jgi:putative transposase
VYQSCRKEQDMIDQVKQLARKHPRFGYRRLHQMLLQRIRATGRPGRLNVKRVQRLCRQAGLSLPRRRRKKRRGRGVKFPVLAEHPNHVWAYDFVFDWSANGRQLKFLTVIDEFTRECLTIQVDHRMGARQVCAVLERLMRQRGVPAFVRSDNGPEFIAKSVTRMLAVKGVDCKHIDPGSPWQNGRNERFNGTFRDECANMETFHHKDHARAIAELFRRYYNTQRPHSSLDYQTPQEFARRHPPLGAGSVVSHSRVPSPAPKGGCRNVPVGSSTRRGTVHSL